VLPSACYPVFNERIISSLSISLLLMIVKSDELVVVEKLLTASTMKSRRSIDRMHAF